MGVMDNISEQELEALQGPDVVQPLELEGIQTEGYVLTPRTPDDVAKLLWLVSERGAPLALRRDDALLLDQPVWMNLEKMAQIRNHRVADLTVSVETGIPMGDLKQQLAAHGQCFPLSYPDPLILADVIAADRPGPETSFAGFPRDYVLGVEMVTPDGAITHYGGEVVKNVTGYDLNKLYTGSHHTLGVITAVTLKLTAIPDQTRDWFVQWNTDERDFLDRLLPAFYEAQWPLTIADLFSSDGHWMLWLRGKGTGNLLDATEKELRAALDEMSGDASLTWQTSLSPTQIDSLMERCHLDQSHIVSLAVPKGQITETLEIIEHMLPESLQPHIRLGAGLWSLTWPTGTLPKLADMEQPLVKLAKKVHEMGGHLSLIDFPAEFMPLAETLNSPHDSITRDLTRRLKAAYDPAHVLFSRRLPFSPSSKAEVATGP